MSFTPPIVRKLIDYAERKKLVTPEHSRDFVSSWYQYINEIGSLLTEDEKELVTMKLFDYMSSSDFWRDTKKQFLRRPERNDKTFAELTEILCPSIPRGLQQTIQEYGCVMDAAAKRRINSLVKSIKYEEGH